MCFDSDYDWYAAVVEDETTPAAKPTECDECHRVIPAGDPVRHIFMQQYEECRNNPTSDDYEGPETDSEDCPEGCEHDYGETYDYDRCEACDRLIEAIHRHELDEGCREHESRPDLGELYDAMDRGRGPGYLATAERLYPGITGRLPASFLRSVEED